MKKTPLAVLFILLLAAAFTAGCTTYPTFSGMFGMEIRDLEEARSSGRSMEVSASYDEAFDRVLEILRDNRITAYQVNRKKGYIIAMDFPKQTDTTRVGIFFESQDPGHTLITLSSLSSTALAKADGMIFGELAAK